MIDIDSAYVASAKTRKWLVVLSLVFTWGLITALVWKGDPNNTLHTSALAWSFVTNGVTLSAYAFGTVIQNYVSTKTQNRPGV